jgi:transketolase
MEEKVRFLKEKAKEARQRVLEMIYKAQSGHPGGSLSLADILAVLYYHELNIDPKNPHWENRDRLILSKGHVCPIVYTYLAMKGYFELEVLNTLRKEGSILQGHPDMNKVPGIDMSTGSLGQGLSCGVGMAIASKRDNKESRVFVLMGDGENDEGQIWEAAMSAAKYKLDNLIGFVDKNNLQNDGSCNEIMPLGDLAAKWRAFGWEVVEVDGHNISEIMKALDRVRDVKDKPKCIIANTVKGKGVSFMENVFTWHGMAPNTEQYEQAITEIQEVS